ncbi:MAG: DUF423 domain-containing protein [Bacteroidetes bacterium]|uniref:DUF423 domain-containing protein n=2 Tax=Mesohalobacter halotolerans TaxID=1883405 RepID=A0A4U5TU48_9FLAO|nr:DUF423 domain-containing protein [Bacteroidota bacterium]TKS57024.1 DUF423 domain-containing protein [Mesohalobacter halotolerans]
MIMAKKLKLFGAFFGMTAVIIGAFGAHTLAEQIDAESLRSFETGVKYQMYHALLLIILGFNLKTVRKTHSFVFYMIVIGIIMFSGSIYGLATNGLTSFDFTTIAFITPIGGSLLILSWLLIFVSFLNKN